MRQQAPVTISARRGEEPNEGDRAQGTRGHEEELAGSSCAYRIVLYSTCTICMYVLPSTQSVAMGKGQDRIRLRDEIVRRRAVWKLEPGRDERNERVACPVGMGRACTIIYLYLLRLDSGRHVMVMGWDVM
jgi:hypothetical protein